MEYIRDEYGAIELKKLNYELLKRIDRDHFIINYDNDIYYLKYNNINNIYNGLLAQELASDYNIDITDTDIFVLDNFYGTMSKSIIGEFEKFIPMSNLVSSENNNLEDIWNKLSSEYSDKLLVAKLMDEIINMFIFDILIGNIDRHNDNYGFICKDKNISLAPLFDNENMLSSDSINECYYALGVNSFDYNNFDSNILYKFLVYSDKIYLDKLKSKLWIIQQENMIKVISRIENKIGCIHPIIKKNILQKMNTNLSTIKRVIYEYEGGVKKYAYTI